MVYLTGYHARRRAPPGERRGYGQTISCLRKLHPSAWMEKEKTTVFGGDVAGVGKKSARLCAIPQAAIAKEGHLKRASL